MTKMFARSMGILVILGALGCAENIKWAVTAKDTFSIWGFSIITLVFCLEAIVLLRYKPKINSNGINISVTPR